MVSSTLLRSKALRGLLVVLAALLFAGCGTQQNSDHSAALLESNALVDSDFYLQQMRQSSDDSKTNWQLLALRALLKENKNRQALLLYSQLPQNLNETQRREQLLLGAEIRLMQQEFAAAKSLLEKIDVSGLNKNQQSRYWQCIITAQQGQPSLALIRALIARQSLLVSAQDKQKNIDATWQALTSMSRVKANNLVINADENVLQGWLDLQRMWFDNRNDPDMLKAGIRDWQTRYPQNPGATMLPAQLINSRAVNPVSTNKIALLLPLNGQAALFGRAIQQGFEAAKNGTPAPVSDSTTPAQLAQMANPQENSVLSPSQAEVSDLSTPQAAAPASPDAIQTQSVVTAPSDSASELKIYDTTTAPIEQILAQVQQDGAAIVVGPLLKNNVEELVRSNISLSVLALNQPESVENRANICYFALSPEDEARDAAHHIFEQGKRVPLLLIPRTALGDRVANAFARQWQDLGGDVVLQQKFGSLNELRSGVNGNSGITLTGSPVNTSPPQQQNTTSSWLTTPALPADVQTSSSQADAVYIVATSEEIAYIKPMITMRNGSQSSATLYASSRSAQGTSGPDFRLEMEGMQYSEIPMLAGSNPALMRQALNAVNNDYSLARLYAMGVDAWSLANHFQQMRQSQGFELQGNTGDLTTSQDCVINRKLSWLKYQQGQIVPAS